MRYMRSVKFKRRPKKKARAAKKKVSADAVVDKPERRPARNPFFTEWWYRAAEKQAERKRDGCDR